MEKQWTEETMAEYLETDFRLSEEKKMGSFFWRFFLLCCGWVLPSIFRTLNEDAKIPGYIWFFYVVFQVFGIGIWIENVFSSIRYCNSRTTIEAYLIVLCLHLVSCIAVFGYYCVTELYIYKDFLIWFVRFT